MVFLTSSSRAALRRRVPTLDPLVLGREFGHLAQRGGLDTGDVYGPSS